MSMIRSKNTKPELVVRSLVHRMGFRYRLHRRDLPGCPDITLSKYKAVIFVHGCFWHFHQNCRDGKIPQTNSDYWGEKLLRNAERDKRNLETLHEAGWRTLVIWECEVRNNSQDLQNIIARFLNSLDTIA